jgi:hypothetical protein
MAGGSPNGGGTPIRAILLDGETIRAQLKISHDGIEYVGRLFFESEGNSHPEIVDHAPLPGRDTEEVLARALRFSEFELGQRYRRALGERRRFRALRRATNDVLDGIRQLNELTIAMRAGLIDAGSAAQEIQAAERRLHQLIDGLWAVAGHEE